MAEPLGRLLIVDDEAAQMQALCDTLTVEGYATTGFVSAKRALAALRGQEFDLLLTDLMMPETDGIALLSAAREIAPNIVAIVMTGHAAIDTAVKAMQAGALDYIVKPFKLNVILPVINRALAMRKLRLANAELEQSVRERTAELEVVNRQLEMANFELEAFSYSVSHDLRAPLRTAREFCQIFVDDFKTSIPADGMSLLEHVLNGTERMGRMIEDLLTFSRLSRQPISRRSVPLADIAQRVTNELRASDPQRHLEVRIGELGICAGDPSLLEQVFVNLLSNAFKFTRGRDQGVIEVGCSERGEERIYFVRDNGAGFDMKYVDKLFGVFQRLHSAAQFEGTGVGLSIVQRIVNRHGGRVWAESEVDQGTTFFFTIPDEHQPPGKLATKSPVPKAVTEAGDRV